MTTKHTPGPWTIEEIEHTSTHSLFYVSSDDEEMIATCEDEANAHLIAAAPDLLEALEAALGCLVFFGTDQLEPLRAQCRAAVRKAKGETK